MDEKIDLAIQQLLTHFKAGIQPKPDEALKTSQAVLNLSHAKQLLAANAASGKK